MTGLVPATDCTFVLTGAPLAQPPGGFNIVYQLAGGIARRGRRAVIVYVRRDLDALYRMLHDPALLEVPGFGSGGHPWLSRVANTPLGSRLVLPVTRRLSRVDYDFRVLDGVRIEYCGRLGDLRELPEPCIATTWQTAYYVADHLAHRPGARAWYLVQALQDDPSVTGHLAHLAHRSYELPLQKIVINRAMEDRFRYERPATIRIGVDHARFSLRAPIEGRAAGSVVVPLRGGEHKAGAFALEVLARVRAELPSAEVVGFGDLPPGEVPAWVRYYHRPRTATIVDLLNSAAVFFLPSRVEGLPATILEAMCCGAATVSTDNDGARTLVDDPRTGRLVPKDNPALAARALIDLLSAPADRIAIARAGAQLAAGRTYSVMVDDFLAALGGRSAPAG